jgi:hypothetical protein
MVKKGSTVPLATVLAEFVQSLGWGATVEHLEDGTSFVSGEIILDDNTPRSVAIETEEEIGRLSVFFYTPFSVPPKRLPVMLQALNALNRRTGIGRFACGEESEAAPVQFRVASRVADSSTALEQLEFLFDYGSWVIEQHAAMLEAIALTDITIEEACSYL